MRYILFENSEVIILFDTNHENWYSKSALNEAERDLSVTNNLSGFLQVFYFDPSDFFTRLFEKVEDETLRDKIIETFPLKQAVTFCIQNKMYYWLELALKWLEFINFDEDMKSAIKTVIDDTKAPQSLRHKLQKLIRSK